MKRFEWIDDVVLDLIKFAKKNGLDVSAEALLHSQKRIRQEIFDKD